MIASLSKVSGKSILALVAILLAAMQLHAQTHPLSLERQADSLLEMGEPETAKQLFDEAIQAVDDDLQVSRLSIGAGMCEWQLGKTMEAIRFWNTAMVAARGSTIEAKRLRSNALSLLSSAYQSLGNAQLALAHALSSLRIAQSLPDNGEGELAYAYNNIGAIYFDKSDWDKAIEYYTQSYRSYLADSMTVAAALPLVNLGLAWLRKEEFQKAIQCFEESREWVLQDGDPALLASLYNNHGLACLQSGAPTVSLPLFQKVLNLPHVPPTQLAIAKANMGFAHLRLDSPAEAQKWLQDALDDTEGALKPARRAKVLQHLSEAQLALAQPEAALAATDEGIHLLLGLPIEAAIHDSALAGPNRDSRTLFQLLAAKANAQIALQQRPAAALTFQNALRASDLMRQDLLAQGSKLFLSSFVVPVLEAALENEWQLSAMTYRITPQEITARETRILDLFERNKALLLQEERQLGAVMRSAGIPAWVLEAARSLQSDVDFHTQKAFEARNAGDSLGLATHERNLFEKTSALDRLNQELDARFPALQGMKTQLQKPKMADLQAYAKEEDLTMVEYFWGRKAVYALVVAANGPRFLRLCQTPAVEDAVQKLAGSLADWNAILSDPAKAASTFREAAQILSDSLLRPVLRAQLPARLLCIPDGPLARIPLEALPVPGSLPQAGGLLGYPYLIRQTEVRYAWSASMVLAKAAVTAQPQYQKILAMAPMAGEGFSGGAKAMHALPGSQAELAAIAQYCDGQYLLGKSATKAAFLEAAPQYSILHLALHGNLSPTQSAFSNLSFQSDSAPVPLYAWEIERLHLPATMVVLSACETGAGELSRGEGVLSLGRSFIAQGARSVVTTLWKVEDKASAQVMGNFYAALAMGQGRGQALRQAKLDYLAQADDFTGHPAFWAGFVLMGDAGKIEFEAASGRGASWLWWMVVPLLALGIWVRLRMRLRRE